MNTDTGLIMAIGMEAKPFINGLGMTLIEKKPHAVYGNESTVLALSGIGKASAAIATTHLINRYSPARIINLGSAGATGTEFKVGDIAHISAVFEPDRPILDTGAPMEQRPDILPGFTTASLATQDRPILKEQDRQAAGVYADLVDMEGAAVIQACRAFGVKVHLFKVVTDTAGCSVAEIIRNIAATRKALFEFYRDQIMPLL